MVWLAATLWDRAGARGALLAGALATAVQLLADRLARKLGVPATVDRLKVYAIGALLRFGGVLLIAVAAYASRGRFSFAGASLGYLGVILPLLYLETRLGR